MTKNEAYKRATEVLIADVRVSDDQTYHSSISKEDYLGALYDIISSLHDMTDTDKARDAWDDRVWAQAKSTSTVLYRIYGISCYSHFLRAWALAAQDVENLAKSYGYKDEAESYDYDEYHNIVRSDG